MLNINQIDITYQYAYHAKPILPEACAAVFDPICNKVASRRADSYPVRVEAGADKQVL